MSLLRSDVQIPAYRIADRVYEIDTPGFAEAIARAHEERLRPRCLCRADGVEMYVARLGDGFLVKRMPDSGSWHAPACASYEPPPELSGLGQVLGSAITENTATGETTLRLDFPISKMPGRSAVPSPASNHDSARTDGTKLSLRGLLHYLWDQAELTKWHPAFAGRRTWSTVRRHLLAAAQHKLARGVELASRLYIPESFSVEERDSINARRRALWAPSVSTPGKPQHLMLLIGEVKEITPARFGHKAVIKHLPDQAFALDAQFFNRLSRRFEAVLSLWGASDSLHMIAIATFGVNATGVPSIVELSLMPVTPQWLPIEDSFDQELVGWLVRDGRNFTKGLRYNLPAGQAPASAVLTDTGEVPTAHFIATRECGDEEANLAMNNGAHGRAQTSWIWRASAGPAPALPPRYRAPEAHARRPSSDHAVR